MALGELDGGVGDVVVRRLQADDAHLLRAIRLGALEDAPDAFGETLEGARSADWNARAKDGADSFDRAVFVATRGERGIGMVFVKSGSPPGIAFLGGMWVNPEFRRRGVGRSLVERGMDFLRSVGQAEVALWVTRGHQDVVRFYRSLGFRSTGSSEPIRADAQLLVDELRCSL
jgi:ribosomal protein S18 acetylase RimI-like enzyme